MVTVAPPRLVGSGNAVAEATLPARFEPKIDASEPGATLGPYAAASVTL
jgi:hypothetical protein